jgi:hypothetical protein
MRITEGNRVFIFIMGLPGQTQDTVFYASIKRMGKLL